jgi:hypothetical protein
MEKTTPRERLQSFVWANFAGISIPLDQRKTYDVNANVESRRACFDAREADEKENPRHGHEKES